MELTGKDDNKLGCDIITKDAESAEIMHFDNLRNLHYCEVFLMCGDAGSGVYNTTGLNNEEDPRDTCPDSIMSDFSIEAVKNQYKVLGASLNPPRYWLIDSAELPIGTNVQIFDGLKARWFATLQPRAISGGQPYIPATIQRKSTWIFEAGKPVFIMDDPTGTAWVMKSYTDFVDQNLTYENLETLGKRLKLPVGWSYRVRVLENDLILQPSKGIARIAQDELQNTYDACDEGACNYKP
jgi:hypothetical protein